MNAHKQIAIVAGGDSSEHDVSLRSAAGIYSFLKDQPFDCYIVAQRGHAMNVIIGDEKYPVDLNDFSFFKQGERIKFDFAYITIHGTPGENGLLQGYFDTIGVPYSTSGVLVEALTFNKFALNSYMRGAIPEVHIADSLIVRKGQARPTDEAIASRIGLPCIVKPNAGGSSFGVTKVKRQDDLSPAIDKAFQESDEVMIEALMTGTEITCGCFRRADGKPYTFPITEVVVKGVEFFDYEAKYEGKSDEITPARIAPETAARVSEMTRHIYEVLDCYGIIRIDYILSGEKGKEQINMLEINTTPGMTPASFIPQQVAASPLEIGQVLTEIITGKLK